MSVFDLFRDIKNSAISSLIIKYVNNKIKDFGELVNLKIDTKNKNLELEISQKSEGENIFIKIEKYEVFRKGESNFIKIKKVSAFCEGIKIDPKIAKIIRIII